MPDRAPKPPASAAAAPDGEQLAIVPPDAPDAAPAKPKRSRSGGSGRPPGRPTKAAAASRDAAALRDPLAELLNAGAGALVIYGTMRGDDRLVYDGGVVAANVDRLTDALVQLGTENAAVLRALQALVTGSRVSALVGTVAAVAVPIAACHGLLPAGAAALVGAPLPPSPTPVADAAAAFLSTDAPPPAA